MRIRIHRVGRCIERNFTAFADVPYVTPLLDGDERPDCCRFVHSQFYESRLAPISPDRVKSPLTSWLTLQLNEPPMRPNALGRSVEESFMNKRILMVGATGTVGRALVRQIASRHEIISVGRTRGDYQIDITDSASIEVLFDRVGKVDAIVSVTGDLHFGPLAQMSTDQFRIGLNSKLLGQVALALIGQHFLTDGGSITLTGGTVSDEPIKFGANASTVNAALEGFVRGAAVELPRGIRINVVSPSVLQESMSSFGPFFPGIEAVPGSRVALGYVRSIEGVQTGRVYRMT